MESKKLFEELFEEEDIEEYAGATKKECHNWYQSVIGGCYGTGMYSCSVWYLYCSNPPRY